MTGASEVQTRQVIKKHLHFDWHETLKENSIKQ